MPDVQVPRVEVEKYFVNTTSLPSIHFTTGIFLNVRQHYASMKLLHFFTSSLLFPSYHVGEWSPEVLVTARLKTRPSITCLSWEIVQRGE